MSVTSLDPIWNLPTMAFELSMQEMAHEGHSGKEGIALWLGRRASGTTDITHVVVFRGKKIRRGPDILIIDAALMNDLTDFALEVDAVLVGQIHSHPGTFTNLSIADRKYGIAVPSFLSVVAPYFATNPNTQLTDCGVHVFQSGRGFQRLSIGEVLKRIRLVASSTVPIVTVGVP